MEERNINEPVAGNIRQIAKNKKIKQGELATMTGLSRQALVRILTGRRRVYPDEIATIAKALEVTPNALFGMES